MLWSHRIDAEPAGGAKPGGDDDELVEMRSFIAAIDAQDDGSAVVAVEISTTTIGGGDLVVTERSVLQWYAADGSLVRTRALDATYDSAAIISVRSVLALLVAVSFSAVQRKRWAKVDKSTEFRSATRMGRGSSSRLVRRSRNSSLEISVE